MTIASTPSVSQPPTFAQLLRELFKRRLHPEGREYTVAEVAMAFPSRSAQTHLYKLLDGEIQEPRRPTIAALCRFFQVDASYFFPELADVRALPLEPLPFDSALDRS